MFQLWWGHKTRLQPGLYWARCTGAKLWETERFYVEKAWGKVEQNMENIVVGICFTTYTSISTFLIFFEDPNGILFNNGCYVAFNHQMAISTGYCSNEGWMWYIQHPRPFFGVWFFVSEPPTCKSLSKHWPHVPWSLLRIYAGICLSPINPGMFPLCQESVVIVGRPYDLASTMAQSTWDPRSVAEAKAKKVAWSTQLLLVTFHLFSGGAFPEGAAAIWGRG